MSIVSRFGDHCNFLRGLVSLVGPINQFKSTQPSANPIHPIPDQGRLAAAKARGEAEAAEKALEMPGLAEAQAQAHGGAHDAAHDAAHGGAHGGAKGGAASGEDGSRLREFLGAHGCSARAAAALSRPFYTQVRG